MTKTRQADTEMDKESACDEKEASVDAQEGRDSNASRRGSTLLDIRERTIKTQQDFIRQKEEEIDFLRKTSNAKDDEIDSLKTELAQALQQNESSTVDLKKYEEVERQLQEQAEELRSLRARDGKITGSKRKLADYLSAIGFSKHDLVTEREKLQDDTPVANNVPTMRNCSGDRVSNSTLRGSATRTSPRIRARGKGTRTNPWTIEDKNTNGVPDIDAESITVRVFGKAEPGTSDADVGVGIDTSEGTSETESEEQTEEESSAESGTDPDSDYDPEGD